MEESISLEETNKIRISLGLKPLTDDNAPADSKEKQAEDNYAKRRDEERQDAERKRIEKGIAKVKKRRELNTALKGATLGDADVDVDDTLKWIRTSKKREKELAKKRLQELEEMDNRFQAEEYTEKDLEGLKVSHDFEDLGEGEERILTLKDSRILDNEEDELQNVEMADHERTRRNNELKVKKRDYTGYDDDEFGEGQAGVRRSILAKYDEDLDGSRDTGFRLGSSTAQSTSVPRQEQEKATASVVNKSLLSIDYEKNMEIADYLQEGDVGFKKPKTKKKRQARRMAEDSTVDPSTVDDSRMMVDGNPTPMERNLDTNFVDDDDLQASLARARRAKIKKPKVLTPEEIALRLAERAAIEDDSSLGKGEGVDDVEDGLTFDDGSEFLSGLSYKPVAVKREPKQEPQGAPTKISPAPQVDVDMNGTDGAVDELEAGEVSVKEEDEEDEEMLYALEDAIRIAEGAQTDVKGEANDIGLEVGTSSEQNFGSGMAATLNILRQQGVLAGASVDEKEREHIQRKRDLWLAEYRTRLAKREMDRIKARGEKKDQSQREYENRLREQQELRDTLELFKDYKPDVNIEYHDEFGRALTPKEAWKALSHRFHGKGSGKMKTEKRLKKIAEEKKKEAMASGDTPLSMNRAFQIRQEKAGQAHFVLSVGSRGAVPQAAEFLEPPTLSKGKTEKTKAKKKDSAKGAPASVDAAEQPAGHPLSSSASPGPSSFPGSHRDSPAPSMMKSSFSQVHESASAGSGSATPADRTKVAFGFGTKRKAADGNGQPPTKRR